MSAREMATFMDSANKKIEVYMRTLELSYFLTVLSFLHTHPVKFVIACRV